MKINPQRIDLKLSVRNKLYASFIAVAMLAVLTGGIGYVQVQSVHNEMEVSSKLFEIKEIGSTATKMIFELSAYVDDYVSYDEGSPALRSRFVSKYNELGGKINELHGVLNELGDAEFDSVTDEVDAQFLVWVNKAHLLMDTYDEANAGDSTLIAAKVKPVLNNYEVAFDGLFEKLVDFEEYASLKVLESKTNADVNAEKATRTIAGVAGVSLVLAIALGVVISNDLSHPLGKLVIDVGAVANGDLGHEFEVKERNDEIGEVIVAIKEMVTNTAFFVDSVRNASDKVVTMSKEFNRMSQEVNESMDLVTTSTKQISDGAVQLSTLSQESSQNANRLSAVLQQTGANSAKAGESIQQIMTAMETTTSTVENMDKSLEEIGSLANIVTDVANQTQLLALNAAIEAARAGEAGRGFAVVADAVRELSEQTNQAAADTLNSVAEVQKNGKDAIAVAQGSTEEAAEGVNVVNETITGVNQGVAAIEAVVKAIDEIASIAEESASSAEMNTAATEQQTAAMSELATNAADLEEIAAQLQAEMVKFQI
jgi:methyl-accepting chemotaxis protein